MFVVAVSSSFKPTDFQVFTDGEMNPIVRYGKLGTLDDTEWQGFFRFVFEEKLKVSSQMKKDQILSITGILPRELALFAKIVSEHADSNFHEAARRYLASSSQYYYQRFKKF